MPSRNMTDPVAAPRGPRARGASLGRSFPDAAAVVPEDDASRGLRSLEENARLAHATLLAIDSCVEAVIHLLSCGVDGPERIRERAIALGLHRLEEHMSRQIRQASLNRVLGTSDSGPSPENESLSDAAFELPGGPGNVD